MIDLRNERLQAIKYIQRMPGPKKELRDCVGFHHEGWRDLSYQRAGLGSGWDLNSLFVLSYLKNFPSEEIPKSLIDYQDEILTLARSWRENSFPSSFFRDLRVFETRLAAAIPASKAEDAPVALDICCVLSYFWAQEYIFRILPASHEAPVFKGEKALQDWANQEKERVKMTQLQMSGPLLRASVLPGELEQYSRKNGGVQASDISVALENTRPYVAHKALVEVCDSLSLTHGRGMLVFQLVSRHLASTLNFTWARYNVFLDYEFMSEDKHSEFRHRTQPWIILMGSTWVVVHKERSYQTDSPYRAILTWFSLLEEPVFWMNMNEWDLKDCIFLKFLEKI